MDEKQAYDILEAAVYGAILAKGYSQEEARELILKSREYLQEIARLVAKGGINIHRAIQDVVRIISERGEGAGKERKIEESVEEEINKILPKLIEVINTAVEEAAFRAFEKYFRGETEQHIINELVKEFLKNTILLYNTMINPPSSEAFAAVVEAMNWISKWFKIKQEILEHPIKDGECPMCHGTMLTTEELANKYAYCPHCNAIITFVSLPGTPHIIMLRKYEKCWKEWQKIKGRV